MSKPLKILIVGGACTGKTTLAQALCKKYPQFKAPSESVRILCEDYSYRIDNGNTPIQMSILALEASEVSNPENLILDSCLLGSRAYTEYYLRRGLSDIRGDAYNFYCDFTSSLLQKYVDLIIFPRAGDFPVVEDSFRIVDEEYTREVDSIIEELIKKDHLESRVVEVTGPVEERVKSCSERIEKLLTN